MPLKRDFMTKLFNFSSYVVKVASRCNLNCDYCYMYQHIDQSWKDKPRCLSKHHQDLFAKRIREYAAEKMMKRIVIIYHGGEPLLFGADNLIEFTKNIRMQLKGLDCKADFGIQTNGTLLKEAYLEKFREHGMSISLSIDGPKEMHDLHRLDLKNKPTFDKVYQSLLLLKKYPEIFTGCISVINPYSDPRKLFQFFHENEIAEFSFLLPDANYVTPPPGRKEQPDLYKNWLIKAFDCWFEEFSHIKCKYFDWLLMAVLGHASQTDSFGLGDVSLLVIETDGSYHDHDVLKITEENGTALGLDLDHHLIIEAENTKKIQYHRHLLTQEGLSAKCQACVHMNACGGGFIGHRFSREGYKNPSIYCEEIYSLIDHIVIKVRQKLQKKTQKAAENQIIAEFDEKLMLNFWNPLTSSNLVEQLQDHRAKKNYVKLQSVIPYALKAFPDKIKSIEAFQKSSFEELKKALVEPTVIAWIRAIFGQSIHSPATNVANQELPADPDYFEVLLAIAKKRPAYKFVIQSPERWFRYSLGPNIKLEHDENIYQQGLENLQKALDLIRSYNEALHHEMLQVSRHIQLVKDCNASPDKDVSFSDVTIPGVIFIGVWKSNGLLSPYMVAASLIHEHLHQKLYLLQSRFELFHPQQTLIYSPWPKVNRPPSGALHAVYVFTHVAHFWKKMLDQNQAEEMATCQLEMELVRLEQCISEIKRKVAFTATGQLFFNCLLNKFESLSQDCTQIGKCLI